MQKTPVLKIPFLVPTDKAAQIPEQSREVAEFLEAKVLDGTLKGQKGEKGMPGVNAVPADTAVASYITSTSSLTHSAVKDVMEDGREWHEADLNANVSGYTTARYCKVNGIVYVHLHDVQIKAGNEIFQLPPGYRPSAETPWLPSTTDATPTLRVGWVNTTGNVRGSLVTDTKYRALITFPAF